MKKKLTEKQWVIIGKILKDYRDSSHEKKEFKNLKTFDEARSRLENIMFEQLGDKASIHIFYGYKDHEKNPECCK